MNQLPSTSYANELRLAGEFSDIVLKVGQRSFPCHRMTLASSSKYFRNLFSKNYKEAGTNEIELKYLSADDFELILTHIYGGRLSLNDDKAYRLLRLSIYLDLKTLEELCTKFLIGSTSVPSKIALRIFVFACKIGSKTLLEVFTRRVVVNFVSLSKTRQFLHLSREELLKILTHPNLTKDVTVILNCIVDWMKFQSTKDENLLPQLLSTVNVPNIPKEWIEEKMKKNRIKKRSRIENEKTDEDEIDCYIVEKIYTNIFEEDAFFCDVEIDDTESQKMKLPFTLFLGGKKDRGVCINVCKLDSPNNHQSLFTINPDRNPNESLKCCKAALVTDVPFMLTVHDRYEPLLRLNDIVMKPYCFNQSNKSEVRSLLPAEAFGRYSTAKMAVIDVEVFLYLQNNFHVFNCERNEWMTMSSKNGFIVTEYSDLLTYQNNLYVVGGQAVNASIVKEESSKAFQRFDRREGKWLQLPKMKYGRCQAASCIHNDTLYVSGGSNLTYFKCVIESFDFKAGRWGLLETSMIKPKMNHKVIAHNDQLWFFGGESYQTNNYGTTPDLTWYSYDFKNNKWSDIFSVSDVCDDFKTREIFDVLKM